MSILIPFAPYWVAYLVIFASLAVIKRRRWQRMNKLYPTLLLDEPNAPSSTPRLVALRERQVRDIIDGVDRREADKLRTLLADLEAAVQARALASYRHAVFLSQVRTGDLERMRGSFEPGAEVDALFKRYIEARLSWDKTSAPKEAR